MDAQLPADDQNKDLSTQQDTSGPLNGTNIQPNKCKSPADGQGKARMRTKVIVAVSVLLALVFIGSAINATVIVCHKGQEQFDDDSHPLRAMRDAFITSFTNSGKDKELFEGMLELLSAETASAQGNYAKAHASFERVCLAYKLAMPNSYNYAGMLNRVAAFEYQFDHYREAESRLREAVKVFRGTDSNMHPFNSERWLAYTLIKEGKAKEALDLSKQIVAEAKDVDKPHMGNAAHLLPALTLLAYAQKKSRQNDNAFGTCNSIISIMDTQEDKPTPRSYAEIFVDMGDVQDDNVKKLADFNRAISIDPKYARAYQFRASLFEKLHKTQEALCDLNRCIELDPKDAWSYEQRASIFEDLYDYAAELKDLNRCIELEPKNAWNYASRAYVFKQTKLFDRSISDLSKALSLDPTDGNVRYKRGQLYKDLKQYDKAREDFATVIEQQICMKPASDKLSNPLLAKYAYLERARVYDLMKKPDLAKDDRMLAGQIKLPTRTSKQR